MSHVRQALLYTAHERLHSRPHHVRRLGRRQVLDLLMVGASLALLFSVVYLLRVQVCVWMSVCVDVCVCAYVCYVCIDMCVCVCVCV